MINVIFRNILLDGSGIRQTNPVCRRASTRKCSPFPARSPTSTARCRICTAASAPPKRKKTNKVKATGSAGGLDADCQKSLAEFAPAGANRVSIIFSDDMRVGENRPSIGREPCVGQPVFLVLFALFVSAGGSPPSPKKNKNPSKIQGCPMRGSSAGAEMLSD